MSVPLHPPPKRMSLGGLAVRIAAGVCATGLAVAVLWLFFHPDKLDALLTTLGERKSLIPVSFLVIIMLTLLMVPGAVLGLLAGAVYGWVGGASLGYLSILTGQVLAFELGRRMFKEELAAWLAKRWPTWAVIERALFHTDGLKMVVLLRLAPAMPDGLLNYALAVTCLPPKSYAAASATALVPNSLIYSYLGSVTPDVIKSITGKGGSSSGGGDAEGAPTLKIVMGVVSGALLVTLMVYVGVTLRKALAEAEAEQTNGGNGGDLVDTRPLLETRLSGSVSPEHGVSGELSSGLSHGLHQRLHVEPEGPHSPRGVGFSRFSQPTTTSHTAPSGL